MKEVKYGKLEVIICNIATDVCAFIDDNEAKLEAVVLEPTGLMGVSGKPQCRLLVFYRQAVEPSPEKSDP